MPEDTKQPIDLKQGAVGAIAGAILTASIMFGTVDKPQSITEGIIEDKNAQTIDSLRPAYQKEIETTDSLGKVTKEVIDVPAQPVMAGTVDGVCNYEIAYICKPGHKITLLLMDNENCVDAFKAEPSKYEWLISARPRFTYHGDGK
jgi:hypothetical protein